MIIPHHLLLLVLLTVAVITDRNNFDSLTLKTGPRRLVAATYVITIALICTALYLSFTPVGSTAIEGVQARYIIPLLFPLLVVLGPVNIKNRINKKLYTLAMLGIPALILFRAIWANCIEHYF